MLLKSLSGSVRLELTSADVAASLRNINALGITISDIEFVGELTVRFTAARHDLKQIERFISRKGDRLQICSRNGFFWTLNGLRKRPILLVGLILLLILAFFLPSRVIFVTVEGNELLPSKIILEAAQTAGIRFGASRRAVRSEKMKNELLDALPQLQWAGINTYGCTAVITVHERFVENRSKEQYSASSIVAAVDGVITSCTVTSGEALCSVGQAVQKGQVLISGYIDLGQTVAVTRAEGEIFAITEHQLTAVTPAKSMMRGAVTKEFRNFSLQIGKKRIKFKKDSGIYDGSCVKMYAQYDVTLPGGYQLPVSIVKETVLVYDMQTVQREHGDAARMLSQFMTNYLCDHGVARTVLDVHEEQIDNGEIFRLIGHYSCTEMIGREQSEEIGEFHGKTD